MVQKPDTMTHIPIGDTIQSTLQSSTGHDLSFFLLLKWNQHQNN